MKKYKFILIFLITFGIIIISIFIYEIAKYTTNSANSNNFNSPTKTSSADLKISNSSDVNSNIVPDFLPGYVPSNVNVENNNSILSNNNVVYNPIQTKYDNFDIDNININIKENSISNSGLIIIITNNNDLSYQHQHNFSIEKFENNNWIHIITKPLYGYETSNSEFFYIEKSTPLELEVNWSPFCGYLSSGLYKLNIHLHSNLVFQEKDISLEFTIY